MDSISLADVTCNWARVGGCEFSQVLRIRNADPDIFVRPTLDELVNQENAILLSKDENREEQCELLIQVYQHYKIQSFSFVCNVDKVEIFQGNLKEYWQTVYGVSVADEECDDDNFGSYRYDVEVEKSGITEITIKFLTHSEVCLFGIILQTAPNPNGITTLLPTVQNLLNPAAVQRPASENCKKFLEFVTKVNTLPLQKFTDDANSELSNLASKKGKVNEITNSANITEDVCRSGNLDNNALQRYIDSNFQKLEARLNQRLLLMEKRQMEKFDCVLKLLADLKQN